MTNLKENIVFSGKYNPQPGNTSDGYNFLAKVIPHEQVRIVERAKL